MGLELALELARRASPRRRALLASVLGISSGCGEARAPSPRSPSLVPAPSSSTPAPAAATTKCDPGFDARVFLARHAAAYGSAAAVGAALPAVLEGAVEIERKTGKTQLVLAKDRHRTTTFVAGLFVASGVDEKGPWMLGGGSGVTERLAGNEAISPNIDGWLFRREWLAFDAEKDKATCRAGDGAPRVEIAFGQSDVGNPVMEFDLASAALLSFTHKKPAGKTMRVTIEAWTEPDKSGVRWPKKLTEHPESGSTSTSTFERATPGLSCRVLWPPKAEGEMGAAVEGEACLAAARDRFTLRWPASGRVRVPMIYSNDEILVRATIGGREIWALLDSGAGIAAVDATMPAGVAFRPALELQGGGATQKVKLGVGVLPSVTIGELRADDVPTASVPIPALEGFGAKRPELILGYSFFAAAVIRVDYKKGEVVFARASDGLVAPGARVIPVRKANGTLLADAEVEGHAATFMVDTGSSGALDLYKRWTVEKGIPGDRPQQKIQGKFGAGLVDTTSVYFRLAKASLGPVRVDGHVSQITDPPDAGEVAGLAGNGVFARCDAVVFDGTARTLSIEGACDRPLPERKMGWRLAKKADAAFADRPWVIGSIWPDGAAERAGARVGDRVLEVGGKPAGLDLDAIAKIESGPTGTKVPIVIVPAADGKKEKVKLVVELTPLLPPSK
jgi:hypothetical protein